MRACIPVGGDIRQGKIGYENDERETRREQGTKQSVCRNRPGSPDGCRNHRRQTDGELKRWPCNTTKRIRILCKDAPEPFEVRSWSDIRQFRHPYQIARRSRLPVDVWLFDIRMSEIDGIEATHILAEQQADAPLL